MKLTRKEFLKGAGAATIGGLLLSKQEAMAHPLVSPEDKAAIRWDDHQPEPPFDSVIGSGPDYVLWDKRLWFVTGWTRSIMADPTMLWGDGVLARVNGGHEELDIHAVLLRDR